MYDVFCAKHHVYIQGDRYVIGFVFRFVIRFSTINSSRSCIYICLYSIWFPVPRNPQLLVISSIYPPNVCSIPADYCSIEDVNSTVETDVHIILAGILNWIRCSSWRIHWINSLERSWIYVDLILIVCIIWRIYPCLLAPVTWRCTQALCLIPTHFLYWRG